ncbi:MAG: AAA family ATPase [Pseudomonadota bacterium]
MARRQRDTKLPAPYLKTLRWREEAERPNRYPFALPWLTDDFEFAFEEPVTILMGENGAGKSTLIETVAAIAGFSLAGGGAWVGEPQDGEGPLALAKSLRAGWLPKIQRGWFLRAGSFENVAGLMASDHLSMSHGEGFASLISDRMTDQGLYILDEPEAALSPRRQAELLAFLADVQNDASAQVVMATHSPLLMAVPGAALYRLTHREISRVDLRDTDHFRLWQAFATDPDGFVAAALDGDLGNLV